jgi:hypothetical protein
MADFDVLEKAKRAREAAAARAAEMVGHASAKASAAAAKASDLRESVTSTAQDVKEALAAAASDLREASSAKIRETLADFNSSVPVLREMGYTLSDVEITLGMPPNVQATFQVSHEVTDEAVIQSLEQNADRKLTAFLIRALSQARKVQTSIQIAGMKPRGIKVEIGLSPGVSIKFA